MVFDVGIRRVYLGRHALWLVVCGRREAGRSWYLTSLTGSPRQIMHTALEGYAERWRVEEMHRHIKQDFHLEAIALRDHPSLKALGVLVMIAASFIMELPQALMHEILAVSGLLPRKRLSDIPCYPFYRVSLAIAILLAAAGKQPPTPIRLCLRDYGQLKLDLVPVT